MAMTRFQIRERRRKITVLLVRGVSPGEMAEVLHVDRGTIYNDIRNIRSSDNDELAALTRKETRNALELGPCSDCV